MANTIQLQEPARISRNTAADGDFLWNMDFARLWANDNALKDAIEQGTKELTPSSGINIDADKNITVNKGKGLKFNGNALEVDIAGKDGAYVTYEGNKIVVSAYNAEPVIDALSDNVGDLQAAFEHFQDEVENTYVPSAGVTNPNKQYAYSTNGWVELADGHDTASFWRPSVSTAGDISWTLDEHGTSTPPATQNIKGAPGTNGIDGKTPSLRIKEDNAHWQYRYDSTEEWQDVPNTPAASGTQGEPGAQGPQGWTPTITAEDDPTTSAVKVTIDWPVESHINDQVFYIPSGDKGDKGDPGIQGPNGYTPSVSAESFEDTIGIGQKYTFYWPAAAGIEDLVSKIYHGNTPTVISSPIAPDPTSEHPNGGSAYNIRTKINGTEYDHIINIWHGNNGQDGDAGNAEGYITGTGTAANPFVLTDEAIEAIETVSGKMIPPTKDTGANTQYKLWGANYDSQTSGWLDAKSLVSTWCAEWGYNDYVTSAGLANNKNWVLSTNNQGKSQWIEANYATEDWLDDHYLPLSGGTVSGETVISGSSNFDMSNLKFTRESQTNIGRIGLNQSGGLSFKSSESNNNNYTQINISPTGDNDKRIALQKMVNNERSDIGYLIPADINTSVPTGGFSNDGILHIVVES